MRYRVEYEDIEIGKYCDDKDKEEYIVFEEGVKKLKEKGYDLLPMIRNSKKGKVAFFDNRIKNSKRFPGRMIGYHTDSVRLYEIDD